MKNLVLLLSVVLLLSARASAQTMPPNEMGVSMGHVHLIARDVAVNKKFWGVLGGTPLTIDGTEVMKFPGVFIFLTPGTAKMTAPPAADLPVICGCPADGFEAGVLNHLGFLVRDFDGYMAKFKAAGFVTREIPDPNGRRQITLYTPDNIALEIAEGKNIDFPITEQHFHFFAPAFVPEYPHRVAPFSMFEWYRMMLGAKLPPAFVGGVLPGVLMRFSPTTLPTLPTKGRTVDHIGFEVQNLEAFSKKLEAKGAKLDQPYSKSRHSGFASVELTDPYGVSIELTEGLNKF